MFFSVHAHAKISAYATVRHPKHFLLKRLPKFFPSRCKIVEIIKKYVQSVQTSQLELCQSLLNVMLSSNSTTTSFHT